MSFLVLDHSTELSDPIGFAQEAKARGYSAIMRYLPIPAGMLVHDSVGRLTAAEVTVYHAEGLGVGAIWETTQYRPLSGASAGLIDGTATKISLAEVGMPPDQVVFGAVDFDSQPPQWPQITAYLTSGGFEPYANGPTCTHLASVGFTHFYLHNWGSLGFPPFSDPHIHQQSGQVLVAGVWCDRNDGYHRDCIWWPPGTEPSEEEDVLTYTDTTGLYRCDPDGAVYAFDSHGKPGGRYLGGLNNHPEWQAGKGLANGPPFIFGPTPEGGYVITTRDTAGQFHPYEFPPDGSLAK